MTNSLGTVCNWITIPEQIYFSIGLQVKTNERLWQQLFTSCSLAILSLFLLWKVYSLTYAQGDNVRLV